MSTVHIPGPTVLVIGKNIHEYYELASSITVSYSDAGKNETDIKLKTKGEERFVKSKGRDKSEFSKYII